MRTLGPAKVTQLASMLMDALLFAGGISVPNVIAYALALHPNLERPRPPP
jgi:hypothetical protein